MDSFYKKVLLSITLLGLMIFNYTSVSAISESNSLPIWVNRIKANSIICFAKTFVGVRYRYGGASPDAFDCSGFTLYIFGNFGIHLPHSASRQSKYGIKVSRNELMRGDLVFFATLGGRSISHVGIYIGEDYFIHSASRGVKINNLGENYYNSRYVTAVRLFE